MHTKYYYRLFLVDTPPKKSHQKRHVKIGHEITRGNLCANHESRIPDSAHVENLEREKP